jgi:hypothetical protein
LRFLGYTQIVWLAERIGLNPMLFDQMTFVGIDPTAGKRPMAFAALDTDLRLICVDKKEVEEVTAFVAGQEGAVVAISGPRRPNQGLMARQQVRASLDPVPRPGRWRGFRVAEYRLYQHNLRIPSTHAQEEDCPGWMQASFDLFRRLARLGFGDYPAPEEARQVLEVYPYAAFAVLLERLPFPKDSLEGRLQRQLVLHNHGLEIPDPMRIFEEITRYRILQGVLPLENLFSAEALDALVTAYTAWMAATNPEGVTLCGDPAEGQIVLPVGGLKDMYK